MYRQCIEDIVESLHEAEIVSDRSLAEKVLEQYWEDKIAVVWTTEDVYQIVKEDLHTDDDNDVRLYFPEERAREVLQTAFEEHDCNYGIKREKLRFWM